MEEVYELKRPHQLIAEIRRAKNIWMWNSPTCIAVVLRELPTSDKTRFVERTMCFGDWHGESYIN